MERKLWRDYDWIMLMCAIALLAIGVLSVYSATLTALTSFGTPLSVLFPRHLMMIGVGFGAMIVLTLIDYRLLSSLARPIYLATIPVLGLLLAVGLVSEGAQSWFTIGSRTIQPAEFAKLALILALAAYWQHFEARRSEWLVQLGGLILAGVPLVLVLIQPDLGSAAVFGMIWLVVAFVAGLRWQQFLLLMVVAGPAAVYGWQSGLLDEYQKVRLLTFYWLLTDPSKVDPDAGYNIIQALNAIGAGGFFGAGLTRGLFSQGNYVPVQQSDFIFAVVGEELGFVGAIVLLGFQAVLLWQALGIAMQARDTFGRLIAAGVFGMLFSHLLINVGMNLSLLPVTGLPLPFISHGGSFMVVVLASIGLLQNVALRRRKLSFG